MIEADRKNFDQEVLEAEGTVIVDFFGDGCVPCAALRPHIDAFSEKYGDKLKFVALNTTKARRAAIAQGIMGLPVIGVYQVGKRVEELVKDAATVEAVEAMIKKYYEQA